MCSVSSSFGQVAAEEWALITTKNYWFDTKTADGTPSSDKGHFFFVMGRQAKKERKKKSMDAIQTNKPKSRTFRLKQLDILKGAFEERKYPDIFMLEELGRETGITVDPIKAWFQMRRAKHRQKENFIFFFIKNFRCANKTLAITGAKVLYLVRPTDLSTKRCRRQSQPNAIDIASVGCTSVSAVRGRAKCRRLFWRAVTFPMNAVAKLVKKTRSAKCALVNKVKKGKNEKK
ncbi:hypothetical protein niasHT_025679 [Heterodera trifolii]|uniref:Homeobox domain-containing protein n=1 Tax=Heterodera trifolii TaxID=157864 RepID=A0ABD2JEJ6_9BILA